MRRLLRFTTSALLAAGAILFASAPATATNEPLRYTFTKTCTLGATSVCTGAASGDVSGALTAVEQPGTWWSDGVAHITFVENVAGETLLVSGILNTHNGLVVMNGRVTDGPNAGARTHHSARIVGFTGTAIVVAGEGFILPGSSG